MFSPVDPVSAELEANAAEVKRLAAQEERRRQKKPPEGRPSGFTLRRWRLVGVNGAESVEALLGILKELSTTFEQPAPPAPERTRAITAALEGEPGEDLPAAVARELRKRPAMEVLRHLRTLREARIEWLTPGAAGRLGILTSTAPARRLVHAPHSGDAGAAYELFVSITTGRPTPSVRKHLETQLALLPLPVVDTLIDIGALGGSDRPWAARPPEEGPYLRARTDPAQLRPAQAEELTWPSFDRRHAFVSGWVLPEPGADSPGSDLYDHLVSLTAGETHHLGELEGMLPEVQRISLRNLRSYCSLGSWPPHMLADRGLWLLMEALWRPQEAIDPRLSPFHAWAALRRARQLIHDGQHQSAATQTLRLLRMGEAEAEPDYLAEVLNLDAYRAFCNDRLAEAEQTLLRALAILPPAPAGDLPSGSSDGRSRLESNLIVVRRRQTTKRNDRTPSHNPFLELGLPHGTLDWEDLYREFTKEALHDTQERARLNDIRVRIESVLRVGAIDAGVFVVPHDERPYQDPDERSTLLVPPLPPLERRTPQLDSGDIEALRARAAVDLLDEFLTAPPRVVRRRS
ncbi:hypothetical protein ACFVFS_00050 [Kitasatospora sp. NPDC057692]|uniref:hypothetical protein n=1 Tax=Kitasatospora sp. NPDC057692 TaxID=3346215 RepID=UPI0036ADD9C8